MTVRQDAPEVQPYVSSHGRLNGERPRPTGPHEADPGNAPKPPPVRQVADWLKLFVEDGQWFEIRAPKATLPGKPKPGNVTRFFKAEDLARAASEAIRLSELAPGAYFTLNPVKPRLRRPAADKDILRRRWLLIDCDPERPADSSATDAEKAEALAQARKVRDFLRGRGWPEPILCDSGNGHHLLYRIELPADAGELVKAVLNALADRFDTGACKIDRAVFNASRITKLYGTRARKGEDTPERPHRYSAVLEVPAEVKPVPAELLESLATEGRPAVDAPKPPATDHRAGRGSGRRVRSPDVEAHARRYLARCQPAISGQGGHNQTLKVAIEIGPGFDLAPDAAFRLLRDEYNPRCEPPWSERELRRKVDEAYRVEARRGWHRDEIRHGRGAHRNGDGRGNGRITTAPPGALPPAETRAAAGDGRPAIVITTEEHEVIDQAVAALAAEPCVFQRGNQLVTVLRDSSRVQREQIHRPKGSPRIAPLPLPRLRELMAKNASWNRPTKNRDGEAEMIRAHPPDWAVNGVAARGCWPEVRPIEAVIEAPALCPDGSILDVPGWHEATELLYEPNLAFSPIPDRPTREDARDAARCLLELVCDFPFAGEHHRAAWLAALLTPLARFAIDGHCPLFLFDANTPGTGKSKLTDIIAIVCTGREMSRTAYPDNDEEMRKRITATALAGDRLMLIDNIATTFGGGSIDAALTASSWKDRRLGASEMTPELPLHMVWYATGNNVGLRGDILRRIVPCRLESLEEHPEERTDFTIKGDLLKHVGRRRVHLVTCALTILRAHALAGRPEGDLPPMGSFESWSEVVRSAVHWATGSDPCATRAELRANDPESIARAALIEGWSELPGSDRGLTVAEALRLLKDDLAGRYNTLRDCLMEWSRNDDLPSAKAIGQRLKAMRGRVSNGRYIQSIQFQGTQVWKVVRC